VAGVTSTTRVVPGRRQSKDNAEGKVILTVAGPDPWTAPSSARTRTRRCVGFGRSMMTRLGRRSMPDEPGADTDVARKVVGVAPSLTGIGPRPAGGEIAAALVTQKAVPAADAQAAPIAVGDTGDLSAPPAPVTDPRVSPHRRATQARRAQSAAGPRSAGNPHQITIGSFARELQWISGWGDDRRGA
jgi:hypothetical protein